MERYVQLPLTREAALALNAGDTVYLTGPVYTSRDAGHKRLCQALAEGAPLPFDPQDATVYYVGPAPAKPGQVIGSAGPTTSGRMDAYAPALMAAGVRGMIGKGVRSPEVARAIVAHGCVYFGAIGGAGALLARRITRREPIAYEDLGAEALCRLWLENFPVTVVMDCRGNDLYKTGPAEYLARKERNEL